MRIVGTTQHKRMPLQVADSFRGQPVAQVQCGSV
jgi:hypothetical protein